jgi:hypothetical protein
MRFSYPQWSANWASGERYLSCFDAGQLKDLEQPAELSWAGVRRWAERIPAGSERPVQHQGLARSTDRDR